MSLECEWESLSKGSKCQRCGYVLHRDYEKPPRKHCKYDDPDYLSPWQPKLGDWTESQLNKIGVTPDWYKDIKVMFGLAPTCNCGSRKDALNEWSAKVAAWWQGVKKDDP